MLPLILGGATLQRCDDCTALNAASATEVTTLARERLFRDQLERDPRRKASLQWKSPRREISPRVQWRPRSDADHASHGPQFSSAVRRYWPVPLSATVLLPAATLSVTVSVPVRAPFTVGAKVTEIVQPNVAASCWGQLLICENSPEFAPVMAMLLMINGVSPVLVSCTGKVVLLPTALVPKASCVWSN